MMRDFCLFKGLEEVTISGCNGAVVKSREEDFVARLGEWFMDYREYTPFENGRFLSRLPRYLDAGFRSRLSEAFVVSAVE
ncbi:uncharacterized protein EAF01_004241 [Botrytis porri]|uniref:uncharacterized protein n=1 Tax=Botrytis porri TaxID=87229 RepID=UPI001901FC91|nr:uncharacterized protein EAF01_004241 [Botrytis porri]KAF7908486.1 hypothetical protein EAF01_004241 [Botrytis porri]